jgi:hypothetical protein
MANLEALPEYDDPRHVIKIVIPRTERLRLLSQLFSMDISRSSLFPGLDGYSQSLGVYHSAYDPAPWKSDAEPMDLGRSFAGARHNKLLQPTAACARAKKRATRRRG